MTATTTRAARAVTDTDPYAAIADVVTNVHVAQDYAVTFTIQPHTEAGRALLLAWARGVGA